MKRFTLFAAVLVFAAFRLPVYAQQSVTLTGLVGILSAYGPSDFGGRPYEDDIETYWVLIPDQTPSEPVQLILTKNMDLKVGTRIRDIWQ